LPVIVLPAAAAVIALACATITVLDALRRPKPESIAWTIAFGLFAVAAAAEVIGSTVGWSLALVRVYYLAGAVLVVGILALGELYFLLPGRMPPFVPGLALLVAAIAATAVWSAPINEAKLLSEGWGALERGPLLVALAASINAGGTLILAGGAIFSAWRLREHGAARRRAVGCILIAVGTLLVAAGGTLTRLGNREYLYLAMALGITVIFSGVMLTRARLASSALTNGETRMNLALADVNARRMSLIALPSTADASSRHDQGIAFIASRVLPLGVEEIIATCRQWSATIPASVDLSRVQARQVWALRLALPDDIRDRFDDLPLPVQAQLAELYFDVWSGSEIEQATLRQA
jgi:hypothetical protein